MENVGELAAMFLVLEAILATATACHRHVAKKDRIEANIVVEVRSLVGLRRSSVHIILTQVTPNGDHGQAHADREHMAVW